MSDAVIKEIAATGTLQVGINLGNMLLVTDRATDGTPIGVAPDLASALGQKLGIPVQLVPFPKVGQVADAISGPDLDIGLIAWEPERAKTIAFSDPYVEIEATYLVAPNAAFNSIEEVDRPGVEIAVADRAAYDLYLKRTLQHAKLVRGSGLGGAFELFKSKGLPVLAGLRPALQDNAQDLPGSKVLSGQYTSIQQAIGIKPGKPAASAFLNKFIAEAKASGLVAEMLRRHGVSKKLTLAP
ncbi:MAG: transporter substrate-binding domain-containing protein [Pseudomonadota bacterium]